MASTHHSSKDKNAQHRQIRALFDDATITVYQAYNATIATAAVKSQCLSASPLFRPSRMTWIKPSWNWMMYRAGYSFKDANQSNILALKLSRTYFEKLLLASVESTDAAGILGTEKLTQVRVQWDPERNFRIGGLGNDAGGRSIRSIQIGIPRGLTEEWIQEGILEIEDVTEKARELKAVLDAESEISEQDLLKRGLIPTENVYEPSEEVRQIIGITAD